MIEIIKMFLHFWFFTCCSHPFSFQSSLPFCSNTLTLESIFEYIQRKLKKHAHFKISSRYEMFTRLFFFFSSRDEISSLPFWQGCVHPGIKFHLGKKRVNSKRHFNIDRHDFVPGRVSFRDEISRVNTV